MNRIHRVWIRLDTMYRLRQWLGITVGVLAALSLPRAFHLLERMDRSDWRQPLAWAAVLLLTAGVASTIAMRRGKADPSRCAVGEITGVNYHRHRQALDVAVQIKGHWGRHQRGQFGLVHFGGKAAPHPFTITSDWRGDGRMRLLIQEREAMTRTLSAMPKVGDLAWLDRPYGKAKPNGSKSR